MYQKTRQREKNRSDTRIMSGIRIGTAWFNK
jgi:hypothetical protein